MEDSENTEDHRALPPLRSEKLLQYCFWCFVDTRPIVRPRFLTHFADILNSQLMYTVQLLMVKGGLTLIFSFPKASFLRGFAVQVSIASSIVLFRSHIFGLRSGVIASSASKTTSVAAKQRALLVFPARNRAYLKPLCGTICKCELCCLNKRSPHFINQ